MSDSRMNPTDRYKNDVEILKRVVESHQAGIFSALPLIIRKLNAKQNTVEAESTVKLHYVKPDKTEEWLKMPKMADLPVYFPGGGGVALTFPVKDGDEGLAVFASRSIDKWWHQGGVQEQTHARMQSNGNISDGFVLPGFRSRPNWIKNVNEDAFQIRNMDGKATISLDPRNGGSIAMASQNNPTTVTGKAFNTNTENVTLGAQGQVLMDTPLTKTTGNIKSLGSIDASGGFFKNGVPVSGGGGGGGSVGADIGATPPLTVEIGGFWWDTVSGQLFIRYDDGTSTQWVVANNNAGPIGPIGPQGPPGELTQSGADLLYVSLIGDTMTGYLNINPGPGNIGALKIQGTGGTADQVTMWFEKQSAPLNQKIWEIIFTGGNGDLHFRAVNDIYTAAGAALTFERGTGVSVSWVTSHAPFWSEGNITSTSFANSGQIHMAPNAAGSMYGSMWRNDGITTYLLLTNNNDAFGTFNGLRPFHVDNASGNATFGHNITVGGQLILSNDLIAGNHSIYTGNIGAGIGQVGLHPGDSTHTGYVEWWKVNGSRLGYMGYWDDHLTVNIDQGGFRVNSTFTSIGSLDPPYRPLSVYRGGWDDPLEVKADQGRYARVRFHVSNIRIWSAGCTNAGTFGIYDESGAAQRLSISLAGAVYCGANFDSGGAIGAAGGYYSGGRLAISTNASHSQLYRPDGWVALYLSQDGPGTNYYRNQIHKFDDLVGNSRMFLDGNVNVSSGHIYMNSGGSVLLNNNVPYYGKDTGGTWCKLIMLAADNRVWIAQDGHNIVMQGDILCNSHIFPWSANVRACGLNDNGWAGVFSYYYGTVSDIRDKKDIEYLPDDCLNYVRAIIPRRFRWNLGIDQDKVHWGFIAQEVQETMGEDFGGILEGEGEEHKLALGVTEMLAVLWRSVQELSEKLDQLGSRLVALEKN